MSETGYTLFEIFCMSQIRTPLDQLMEINAPLAKRLKQVGDQLEALDLMEERRSASSGLGGGYSQNESYIITSMTEGWTAYADYQRNRKH